MRAADYSSLAAGGIGALIDTRAGVASVLCWGAPTGEVGTDGIAAAHEPPLPHGGIDVVAAISLLPESGSGYLGRPGVEGSRADGSGWAPRFEKVTAEHTAEHAADGEAAVFTGISADTSAGLRLRTELRLEAAGVLRVRATLENLGGGDYALHALRVTLPLDPDAREVQTFNGRWCAEFRTHHQPWVDGTITLDNRSGRTSHSRVPMVFVGTPGSAESRGTVWAAHLEWSGNSSVVLDVLPDGRRTLQCSELLLPGEVTLEPGGSYTTPWTCLAWSDAGTNGASAAFHRYLRSRAAHPRTVRPVTCNTWEAVYFDHDLPTLKALADRAAEIGVERYVLDDGWFHARRHDRAGLGDWWVDTEVWPNGLTPLIDHVRAAGMQFGIWVEPEMVNPDSDLYREHPEWVLTDASYEPVLGRSQLVLNLARADVRAYLFEHLDRLFRENDIAYVKWDMNRELVQPSDDRRANVHRQTLGLYALLDDLHAAHPAIEFETCASGGGRIDFAILERTSRVWTSDCQDPLERQLIQRGFSYLFPPELMGAHVAAPRSHTTHRIHTLEMRAATAFFGHFGVEWNLLEASDEDRKVLAQVIEVHKAHRALLHGGTVVRLDHPNPSVLAHGVIASDRAAAILAFVQMTAPDSLIVEPLRVPGLDPDRAYRVELVRLGQEPRGAAKSQPSWLTSGVTLTGRQLAILGLQPPILDPESAIIIRLAAV